MQGTCKLCWENHLDISHKRSFGPPSRRILQGLNNHDSLPVPCLQWLTPCPSRSPSGCDCQSNGNHNPTREQYVEPSASRTPTHMQLQGLSDSCYFCILTDEQIVRLQIIVHQPHSMEVRDACQQVCQHAFSKRLGDAPDLCTATAEHIKCIAMCTVLQLEYPNVTAPVAVEDLVNVDNVRMPHVFQHGHLLAKHKGMKTQHVSTASKNATHDHIGFPNKY